MTDAAAFMAAIIDKPLADAPRLVFADWLEEGGQHDRAEFIRTSCELAAGMVRKPVRSAEEEARLRVLKRRHRELLKSPSLWDGWPDGLPFAMIDHTFDRGFVATIRTSLEVLAGRTCDDCSGEGRDDDGPCVTCVGFGRSRGHARELFLAQPITRVVLVDPHPVSHGRGFWCWYTDGDRDHRGRLPRGLFDLLDGQPVTERSVAFTSEKLARKALEVAAVRFGRLAAGLEKPAA